MFSNTAYEALYEYLGLALHSKFIEILTSQRIFLSALLMIFGVLFFITTVHFFSRYLPGAWIQKRSVPLSKYFKIIACLFIGISVLKVDSHTSVHQFSGHSWHDNPYILRQIQDVKPEYKVSFLFDLLSRTAEEISALVAKMVDRLFMTTNSQLEAPNFFFKAIMFAGTSTIDDENLKSHIQYYVDECLERALPAYAEMGKTDRLDNYFSNDNLLMDDKLREFVIAPPVGPPITCLEVKNDLLFRLNKYSREKGAIFEDKVENLLTTRGRIYLNAEKLRVSNYLVNYFYDQRESFMGIQKGAQPATGTARIYQYLSRVFSWDAITTLFSGGSTAGHGASLAANRAQEFSDNVARAPHIAGAIKMVLIFIFPWLVFVIVAGYWRVLIYWFLIYLSVLLWTPVWTLFYHIFVNISLSADMLEAFGKLSDGVSLYSAGLITQRMNYLFAVYSWIQLLVGVTLTGGLLFFLRPILSDSQGNSSPQFMDNIQEGAGKVGTVAKVGGIVGL